jgi:hypothetical protein
MPYTALLLVVCCAVIYNRVGEEEYASGGLLALMSAVGPSRSEHRRDEGGSVVFGFRSVAGEVEGKDYPSLVSAMLACWSAG